MTGTLKLISIILWEILVNIHDVDYKKSREMITKTASNETMKVDRPFRKEGKSYDNTISV